MNIHLYLMCYRTEALVASHLNPQEFGHYMAVGVNKRTAGNVLFFEVDPGFKSEFLGMPAGLDECVPHPNGAPRRSKYLSIYRVLEHIPISALGRLHCVTRDGKVLSIDGMPYSEDDNESGENMFLELSPVTPRVVSRLGPTAFCKFITDPAKRVSVPRLVFADCLLDREPDGRLAGHLPYRDPQHIIDCLDELDARGDKVSKTVDRNPPLVAFYRTIRRGFFIGDQQALNLYPFPLKDQLEDQYWDWWRSASIS